MPRCVVVQTKTITIIGGGACGTAAFIELFLQLKWHRLHQKVRIVIIEPDEEIGPGMAFGTQQKGHLLNTQADLMGIFVDEPGHFSAWLKNNQPEEEIKNVEKVDDAYTTRRLYGEYLKDQFARYKTKATEARLDLDHVSGAAIDLKKKKDGWDIEMDNGSHILSDVVLLMPGTPDTTMYADLKAYDNYVHAPWPAQKMMRKISPGDDVAILGAGLSAIDAVMTLADHDHTGTITLFSPDGLLPRVQPADDPDHTCRFLTLENIHRQERETLKSISVKELFRLYRQDVEQLAGEKLNWKSLKREGSPAQELLTEDIKAAEAGGDALMQVAYATRNYSSVIWQKLDDKEKKTFADWLSAYWAINRHAMPLPNARRLQKLFASGQLRVEASLKDVQFDDKEKHFCLATGSNHFCPVVVNAIGTSKSVKKMESALLKNLLKGGIIREEKSGGISLDPHTMQVINADGKTGSLYTAGHLANGILLDVNAVWFNVRTIGNLCHHLISELQQGAYA